MPATAERLDLGRPRELGELVSLSLALFARHFSLFFTLTLIVVAPKVLLVDGLWGRALANGSHAVAPAGAALASSLLGLLIVTPLVTAMHARVVMSLGRGRLLTIGAALRDGLVVLVPAALAVLLATIGEALGFILLILPGIWLFVRWEFAAQAVVVEGQRGPGALDRSAEVVRGQWWSTFGRLIVLGVVGGVIALVAERVLGAIGTAVGSPAVYTLGIVFGQTLGSSFDALATTLLFFDRRSRSEDLPT